MNFFDEIHFPFLQKVKDNFEVIRDEFFSVQPETMVWTDYHIHNGKWDVIGLLYEGVDFPDVQEKYPKTTEIFKSLSKKVYTCGFSILNPGCEIYDHVNDNHDVLRCHLCLTTNDNCGLIVNGETKKWNVGDLLVFDDTELHSAHNRGDSSRIIVLFDFYK